MLKHFIKVSKTTNAIIGAHNGTSMPALAESSDYRFEEVSSIVVDQVSSDMARSVSEFRSLKMVNGSPVLGAIPDSVGRIDISINPVLIPGNSGNIELKLLGAGPLTITIAGVDYTLNSGNKSIDIPMSVA